MSFEEIEQFKNYCKEKGLRLPNPCTDEWCIKGIKELEKIKKSNGVWAFIFGFKDTLEIGK